MATAHGGAEGAPSERPRQVREGHAPTGDEGPPLRVAVVGARRLRQGIGPYLARFLLEAGAEVVAVGRTRESAEAAAAELAGAAGRPVASAAGLPAALAAARAGGGIDAVVIASPHETHLELLDRCCEAGVHVLCEKPLVWGVSGSAGEAERIAAGYRERGLLLIENLQWPLTLPAYDRLFPGVRTAERAVERLDFLLCPASRGPDMVVDSASHFLSVLEALSPARATSLAGICVEERNEGGQPALHLQFTYPAEAGDIACAVELVRVDQPPRPAGYGVDGHFAHRRIALPEYRMTLADGDGPGARCVPLPDPTRLLVKSFIARLREVQAGLAPAPDAGIPVRQAQLVQLVAAAEACVPPGETVPSGVSPAPLPPEGAPREGEFASAAPDSPPTAEASDPGSEEAGGTPVADEGTPTT